jgi:hypothetical protein
VNKLLLQDAQAEDTDEESSQSWRIKKLEVGALATSFCSS